MLISDAAIRSHRARRVMLAGLIVAMPLGAACAGASPARAGLAPPPGLAGLAPPPGLAGLAPPPAAPAGSKPLFQFSDPRIEEASGIARGIRSPGVFYVQNDSGDSARFFAVDAISGRTLAVYTVPGATNVDWEDLAVARDSRGVPSIWIADTGDNDDDRGEVRVYRVDEPLVDRKSEGVEAQTSGPQIWRVTYPDGPQDSEALAVAPGGTMYLFNKVIFGPTTVYALPTRSNITIVAPVTKIGSFRTVDSGTAGGPNPVGRLTVTGASLSANGGVLAARTYTDAYLWRIGADGVPGAMKRPPVRIALPEQPQGEGITVDGARLLIDSEKVGSTVWSVPLPALAAPPVGSAPAGSTPATQATSSTSEPAGDFSLPGWAIAALGALAIVAAFGAIMFTRGRRR